MWNSLTIGGGGLLHELYLPSSDLTLVGVRWGGGGSLQRSSREGLPFADVCVGTFPCGSHIVAALEIRSRYRAAHCKSASETSFRTSHGTSLEFLEVFHTLATNVAL